MIFLEKILKFNVDGRVDFMTPETAVALMIGSEGAARPQSLTYTDSDPGYTPPITPTTGETFDTITEVIGTSTLIYGVGVVGKGTSSESVTRLIYPNGAYTTLINW